MIPDVSDLPLSQLISLEGKVAVVTGGARGIGFAIAERLAEAGADVVIGDIHETEAKEAAGQLEGMGFKAQGLVLDATDLNAVADFADRVVREHEFLDIWVNNAGIYPLGPALDMTEQDWDRVIDLNLKGTFFGSREAAKRMDPDRGGVIINLASVAGYRGSAGMAHYVASKHGVRGITRALAAEFAPMGIRVLALAPTLIETPGIAEAATQFEKLGVSLEDFVAQIPLGRGGKPDDVARVALFCASDLSKFLTGSTIPVDGGSLAI